MSFRVHASCRLFVCLVALSLFAFNFDTLQAQTSVKTPSEVVRAFYSLLRERKFQEAFQMSIYKPAIEGLSQSEMDELRPEFEQLASAVPAQVEITGEQVSGATATVFTKMANIKGDGTEVQPVALMRVSDNWIIGDEESAAAVKKDGKEFFMRARIETHHAEAQAMLQRIATAQIVYYAQHSGRYADLAALVEAGLVSKDALTTEMLGYRFHVTPEKDGKNYRAGAEPVAYGRTGKLSYFMDKDGMSGKDAGGKPLGKLSSKK